MTYIQYIILLSLFLTISCTPKKEPSMLIEGSLGNFQDDFIIWNTFNTEPDTIKLIGRNRFIIAPRKYQAQYVNIEMRKQNIEIYVAPNLHLEFITKWKGDHPNIKFDGSGAKPNEFLLKKKEIQIHSLLSLDHLRRYDPEEFDEASLKIYNMMVRELELLQDEKYEPFYHDQQFALDCWHASQKLNYLTLNFPTTPDIHRDIKMAKALIGADGCFIELREYRELVWAYCKFKKHQAIKKNLLMDNRQLNKLQMDVIGEIKMNGESRNYFLKHLLSSIWITQPEEAEDAINFYNTYCKKQEIIDHLQKMTEKLISLHPGVKAPEFLAKTPQDDVVALSDFHGKFIYLFLWSDDSTPCRDEIYYWNKLVARFSRENVVFLGYSFNPNTHSWKGAIKSSHLKGIQLHGNHTISKVIRDKYQVHTVPRFVLIGPKGELISPFAAKPSENIAAILNDFLWEN